MPELAVDVIATWLLVNGLVFAWVFLSGALHTLRQPRAQPKDERGRSRS